MGNQKTPGDICIDQGFTFTHSPLLSLAVIQGPFGLVSNSCYSVGRFKHTQGCISNETPMASQGKAAWLSLCFRDCISVLQALTGFLFGFFLPSLVNKSLVNLYVFTNEFLKCYHAMADAVSLWNLLHLLPSDRRSAQPSSHRILLTSYFLV